MRFINWPCLTGCHFLFFSDDEAILSSKVASNPSRLTSNHEELVRFSTASNVASQPYPLDTQESFTVTPDIRSNPQKESGIVALAKAGLTNHHSPTMDTGRVHTPSTPEPAVNVSPQSAHPQPQRQPKNRPKRVSKGQV